MITVEVAHSDLTMLLDPEPRATRVATGLGFAEGPIWIGGLLFFSDIPRNRVCCLAFGEDGPHEQVFSEGPANGLTATMDGQLVVAEHSGRRLSLASNDGARQTLLDSYKDGRLNSPNDVVAASDGSIYFTDPPYGIGGDTSIWNESGWWAKPIPGKEQPHNGVYRLSTGGSVTLLASDFALPNGLALSPDERFLYVCDSEYGHVRAVALDLNHYRTTDDVVLEMKAGETGIADGIITDLDGIIFATGPGGVWVAHPNADVLGRIVLPEQPSNLTWGEDGSVLYLTARTSIYRLRTRTRGRCNVRSQ